MSALHNIATGLTQGQSAASVCERKVAVGSWAQAQRVARRINQERHRGDARITQPYRCKTCGRIHLGSQVKSATARPRPEADELDLTALRRVRSLSDVMDWERDDA